ncbi:MAG: RpiR family transcriptional regulator [Vicinamibacteria bacterium]
MRALFEAEGWRVREGHGDDGAHLIVRKRGVQYAVETKSAPEGRADRLVPLVAQAVLQAAQLACRSSAPLAVVAAPRIPRRVADQVLAFAERYAPGAAVGVIDFEGLALFRGPRLENLNVDAVRPVAIHSVRQSGQLFSDLNQWMLKVLLAPELPESLLAAPRGRYRNASQLARAADVSVMSAFRFVQQLEREGFLHESASHLSLVRRQELFGRWQALASRSSQDVPMRFVLPGDNSGKLRGMLAGGRACLALFAAADALGLGFVSGVPPYVYLQRLRPGNLAAWRNLRPCAPGEPPDLILRRAPAPEAVFRGLVRPEGMAACDVLQVWLDVGSHPSRGQEQADMIRRRVLHRLIEEGR